MATIMTDNQFQDCFSAARKGEQIVYYDYVSDASNANGGMLLAHARTIPDPRAPVESAWRVKHLADHISRLISANLVTVCQRRNGGICEYIAIRN